MSLVLNLSIEEKKFLLFLARDTLVRKFETRDYRSEEYYSDSLKKKYGVFVTLHKHEQLRGCIGYVEGFRPLQQAVVEMALAAAFEDPRFPPLQMEEVKELEIEISVLSPLKTITDIDEIEMGKHGLIIEKNFNRGLLLPQVAIEQKWDRDTFLKHTCLKAGLPALAWKEKNTVLKIFAAEIFSEKDLYNKPT